jgi:hypothetical protein
MALVEAGEGAACELGAGGGGGRIFPPFACWRCCTASFDCCICCSNPYNHSAYAVRRNKTGSVVSSDEYGPSCGGVTGYGRVVGIFRGFMKPCQKVASDLNVDTCYQWMSHGLARCTHNFQSSYSQD